MLRTLVKILYILAACVIVWTCSIQQNENVVEEFTDICEASPAASIVNYGYNKVLDELDTEVAPTGRPIQVGDYLTSISDYVSDQNTREWALIFSLMSPIREALSCDVTSVTQTEWDDLTEVLDLNSIKTNQDLSGTPTEQYYSSDGIFTHLQDGADYHPMLKYLEEAELELKCLAFESSFDFTNPEGDDHCEIHSITQGSGITLPEADTTDDTTDETPDDTTDDNPDDTTDETPDDTTDETPDDTTDDNPDDTTDETPDDTTDETLR